MNNLQFLILLVLINGPLCIVIVALRAPKDSTPRDDGSVIIMLWALMAVMSFGIRFALKWMHWI